MYTIRALSKKLGVPYTTLRGYIIELKKLKLIKAPEGPSGLMINESERMVVENIVKLIRNRGHSLRSAVEELMRNSEQMEISSMLTKVLLKLENIEEKLKKLEQSCAKKKEKKWWQFWK